MSTLEEIATSLQPLSFDRVTAYTTFATFAPLSHLLYADLVQNTYLQAAIEAIMTIPTAMTLSFGLARLLDPYTLEPMQVHRSQTYCTIMKRLCVFACGHLANTLPLYLLDAPGTLESTVQLAQDQAMRLHLTMTWILLSETE